MRYIKNFNNYKKPLSSRDKNVKRIIILCVAVDVLLREERTFECVFEVIFLPVG